MSFSSVLGINSVPRLGISSVQIHNVQREGGTGQGLALITTSKCFPCRFVAYVSERHPR